MKKAGFTLIELLAVILILGVIVLIAIPTVSKITAQAKKGAFEVTAHTIIDAAVVRYTKDALDGTKDSMAYNYVNGVQVFEPSLNKLDYSGKNPDYGYVIIRNDGEIAIAIHDGTYCAEKIFGDDSVILTTKTKEDCNLDGFFSPMPPAGEVANNLKDSDGDSYLDIWYLEQLKYIESNSTTRSSNYELMRNLDFNDNASYLNSAANKALWTTGAGWKPIGNFLDTGGITSSNQFSGDFNGNNFRIKNLYINRPAGDSVGLFTAGSGDFKNIVLENANVTGDWITGTIMGRHTSSAGVIENCSIINPVVRGAAHTGGLIGESSGKISKSYVINADVKGSNEYVGGFIGQNEGVISESYATGKVENIYVGGTSMMTGGFVGRNNKTIRNSYANVTVINSSTYGHIGGFAGYVWMATVENCYSTGQVIQNTSGAKEGLVGWYYSATITNSYWDMESSGIPYQSFDLGAGLTTTQAKNKNSYIGWDFTNIWNISPTINNGYPFLRALNN